MADEVKDTRSVEERLVDRVKDILPSMLTDDEYKEVIAKAMHKAFFSERRRKDGYHESVAPPLIVEYMEKASKEVIVELTREWVNNNTNQFKEIFDSYLNKKFSELAIRSLDVMFENLFIDFRCRMVEEIQQRLRNG